MGLLQGLNMIDYTFTVLTLKRRNDRTKRFIDYHTNLGYKDKIHIHYGHDGADYSDVNVMRDEMISAYPGLETFKAIGFGNLGCVWSIVEILDTFIKGLPNTEFIHFCQDDILFQLGCQEYSRLLWDFKVFDPDLSCLKLYWHWHSTNDRPDTFKINGYPFTKGWWRNGDCAILLNRRAAKLLLDCVFTNGCFLEHIYPYFDQSEGFYSYCDAGSSYAETLQRGIRFAKPIENYLDQDRMILNTKTDDKTNMPSYDYYEEAQ